MVTHGEDQLKVVLRGTVPNGAFSSLRWERNPQNEKKVADRLVGGGTGPPIAGIEVKLDGKEIWVESSKQIGGLQKRKLRLPQL